MTGVMEQRVREAAKAERAGRTVYFEIQEGGAGYQLVAVYSMEDSVRPSGHVIFCHGSGSVFARLTVECRERFDALVACHLVGAAE
jgi:hypothetical protein